MSSHHVFLSEGWAGGPLPLEPADEHHIRTVLQIRTGETLVVTTPARRRLECTVDSITEGGLTEEELRVLQAADARMVSLGEDLLRAETAGIVGAALVAYEMGGLGGSAA